jgi:cytoskeletal protein RodZ
VESDPESRALSRAALHALREDQPTVHELRAAYTRFTGTRERRSPRLLVSRWLIAGVVMGLGIAFGAEAVVQQLSPAEPAVPSAPAALQRSAPKAAPLPAVQPSSAGTVEPAVEPPPSTSDLKPVRAPSFGSAKAPAVNADDAPADSAVWAKAAEGLRNNDSAETQSALATLEHAGSSTDREAARLVRAQLMLHQGDKNGARALLQDLANNAQAAQVRAKARSLLLQNANANSPLNVTPSGT